MKILLFNSLTRQKEPLQPLEPGKVRMYHCGPTVYSSPHIGNFRAFLCADLLRRVLEDQGLEVLQVMNITDVGHMTADDEDAGADKMEEAAKREKLDPWAIAAKYTAEFERCLDELHFLRPHELPKASDFIPEMGALVQELLDGGYAYQVNGNVYFEIDKFPSYGKLSKKVLDELEAGARVAVNDEKRNPRDFALWKTDRRHLVQWDAPFKGGARGFPGWHLECSAMSMHFLGESFDIHTGGEDNLFPHHECEVAQSEAATGKPFVKTWLHVKHLMVAGQKMSKSLGNFHTVEDILNRGYSGLELRYALLRVQYRQSMNFTLEGLREARAAIKRVNEARKRLTRISPDEQQGGGDEMGVALASAEQDFTAAICDDLNTSEALAAVFGLVSAANKAQLGVAGAQRALELFDRFERVLGCFGATPKPIMVNPVGANTGVNKPIVIKDGMGIREEIEVQKLDIVVRDLFDQREAARKAKDFTSADRLRAELKEKGYLIVDTPSGSRLEKI